MCLDGCFYCTPFNRYSSSRYKQDKKRTYVLVMINIFDNSFLITDVPEENETFNHSPTAGH